MDLILLKLDAWGSRLDAAWSRLHLSTRLLLLLGVLVAFTFPSNRQSLSVEQILNESSLKRPGQVLLSRSTVTNLASAQLGQGGGTTGFSEIFIRNKYDATLCVAVAVNGATCTAICTSSGDHIDLAQGESITIPLPKGSYAGSLYGHACGRLAAADTNSGEVETIERSQ